MPPLLLISFLTGDGLDAAGRSFGQVIALNDAALERHHDFIQWLFPLDEPSRAVPGSPVLDAAGVAVLRQSNVCRDRQTLAAQRMLQFYQHTDAWRRPFDHNHLRITRIIKSLRLLSGDEAAESFKAAIIILAADAPIDRQARTFWDRA